MLLDNTFNISLSDKDLSNLIVHYIFPISIILDYLLFDKKGNHKKYYPVAWCILPYIYMIYVFLRVGLGNGFTVKKGSIYPYDFVDIDKLGISSVVLNIVILTIAFIALGYVIYFLDRKLKINNKG